MGHGLRLRALPKPSTTWLEPRGVSALFARLRDTGIRYAVTGSFAAYRLAPVAEQRLAALYVDDLDDIAAQSLGLRPAETGGNVLLVRSHSIPWHLSVPNTTTASPTPALPRFCWTS